MNALHGAARTHVRWVIILALASALALFTFSDSYGESPAPSSEAGSGHPAYEPPRKQVEAGTPPHDVACREWHVLAIRTTGQIPICVTPATAEALSDRGIVGTIIGHTEAYVPRPVVQDAPDAAVEEESGGGVTSGGGGGAAGGLQDADSGADNMTASGSTGSGGGATVAADTASVTQRHGTQQYGTHRGDVTAVPASTMSVVNFYVSDHDLNLAPNAAEIVPIGDMLRFTINGIEIDGPDTMIETGPNTGEFYVRLELPSSINGRPLNQNDVVSVTYLDQTDRTGEQNTATKSFVLSSTYAQIHSEGDGGKRIGHEFVLRIHEPDANTDSQEENRIHLSRFEFRSEGNIRATLDHRAFDANRSHMTETGPNTGVFEVMIKIPREIDGKVIHIGDWYEITYHDYSTPGGDSEEIVLRGKIGLHG